MPKSLGYIDFLAVKSETSLEQVLAHYGILKILQPHGSTLRGCCPIHKGTNPSQFSVSLQKNIWNCFSECEHGGNHMDFVIAMERCTPLEAAWMMNEWFQLGHEKKAAAHQKPKAYRRETEAAPAQATAPEKMRSATAKSALEESVPEEVEGENKVLGFKLENLDTTHPYLAERGLSPETVAEFGLGYCAKGILAGRIAIPIHNATGALVGNAGRWPGEPPEGKEKYRLPGKFHKSLELFNYHRAAAESAESPLVIVEGFFGVMHLWQLGVRRAVALMGRHLSFRQEEMIARLVTPDSRLLLMLDNDEAGIVARQKIAPRLAEHCFVRSFRWPEGIQQPDELTAEQVAPLLGG